jgi:MFS family permease
MPATVREILDSVANSRGRSARHIRLGRHRLRVVRLLPLRLAGHLITKHFFSGVNETTGYIFALLAFAAGFAVRPFGAVVFGRLGDLWGRKNTFLVTMLLMGLSTFVVGLLPSYGSHRRRRAHRPGADAARPGPGPGRRVRRRGDLCGRARPARTARLLHQLHPGHGHLRPVPQPGGHPADPQLSVGEDAFQAFGWRIPFLISVLLLGVSLWIRLQLSESPSFQKMVDEGKGSKKPLADSFAKWGNLKIVILALVGLTAGQAVVWYTGQFYALFFLEKMLKVDGGTDQCWWRSPC